MKNKKRLVLSLIFVFFIFGVSLPLFMSNHKKIKADTITDLNGYTWTGNTTLNLGSSEYSYSINFTNQNTNYDSFWVKAYGDNQLVYGRLNSTDIVAYDSEYGSGWESNDYKTITIIGGTDVTNANLISWLQNNGTLTAPTPSGTEITHKYWAPYGVIRMAQNSYYIDEDITYIVLYNEQRPQYNEQESTGLAFRGINDNDDNKYSYIWRVNDPGIDIFYLGTTNDIKNAMWLEFTIGDYMDTDLFNFMDTWGYWFDDAEAYIVGMNQGYAEGYIVGRSAGQADGVEYTSLISRIFNGIGDLLSIEVFPNITIGLIIGLPLLLGVFVIIIKILRG